MIGLFSGLQKAMNVKFPNTVLGRSNPLIKRTCSHSLVFSSNPNGVFTFHFNLLILFYLVIRGPANQHSQKCLPRHFSLYINEFPRAICLNVKESEKQVQRQSVRHVMYNMPLCLINEWLSGEYDPLILLVGVGFLFVCIRSCVFNFQEKASCFPSANFWEDYQSMICYR